MTNSAFSTDRNNTERVLFYITCLDGDLPMNRNIIPVIIFNNCWTAQIL